MVAGPLASEEHEPDPTTLHVVPLPASADDRDPYEVGVGHRFLLDELWHLVWSNSVDARDPDSPRRTLVDQAVPIDLDVAGC